MSNKGDTEQQAYLRDKLTKTGEELSSDRFVSRILGVLKPQVKLLDIGCGTGHIISELATHHKDTFFVGLDISLAMLKIMTTNVRKMSHIISIEGDGLQLPFADESFDIVITRLAEYAPGEAYRVLKRGGHFFEYGLGPDADREIQEFFSERLEQENFFFPKDMAHWKAEVCQKIKDAGFVITTINDFYERDYYQNEEDIMNLIEMVPLIKYFDREKDKKVIHEFAEKYREAKGIKITWHYYITEARRL